MKSFLSRRVAAMQAYVPGEQPPPGSLIKLNTNENPYPPSPRVAEAIRSAACENLRLYPSPGADALREIAARRYGVTPAQVLVGNGSDEVLAICLRACVDTGDTVAYPVPTYSLYRTLVEIAGARAVEVPSGRGEIPPALLAAAARITFLCCPNSPTGAVLAAEDVSAFAAASPGLVVVDEAYGDFSAFTALELLADHPNMLVTRSFSKSFSMAGVRLGLAIGSERLIADLGRVKDSYNVSRIAIAAGVAAFEDYDWMLANVAKVCATRERSIAAVRAAGYRAEDSGANFFWVDCGDEGGEAVYRRLRAAGVLVRYFDGPTLSSGVRVSVGTDEEMQRFLEALGTR